MGFLRVILYLLVVAIVMAAGASALARLSDGPIAMFAGGPLVNGPWINEPVRDWSFAADVEEVEFQLLEPARSRTTWIVVHRGQAYIPCGFVNFSLWKKWPHEALEDGRGVVRIDGKRYPVQVNRIRNPQLKTVLIEKMAAKYPVPPFEQNEESTENVWIFRLDHRENDAL